MNHFHIDYEGYSRADLKKVGAFRYAEDSSTEITLCGVARNDEPVKLWDRFGDPTGECSDAADLLEEAATTDCLIYAHNAPFECAVTKYQWKKTFGCKPPALEKWRCTAAMGRRAALPHSLAELGEVLKVSHQKDKRGESLINIFCKPRTMGKLKGQRILPTDEGVVAVQGEKMTIAEAWQLFREYCRRDVVAEREIHKKLAAFELKGTTLRGFQFDLRMNDRGLPVNLDALHKAAQVVTEASKEDIARCRAICGFNPSQVTSLLPWLQQRGYPGENLQAETMDQALARPEGMSGAALEVLKIRARVSFSAVKKIPTMINAAGSDGRVRGTLMWSGAIRTHRWSGKIIQPHNFKKPSIKFTHDAYASLKGGMDYQWLGMLYGNPVEVAASCIRHFIDMDCDILDADYSNIEARIVSWLAGQKSMIEAFRESDHLKESLEIAKATCSDAEIDRLKTLIKAADPYNKMAAKIFGVNPGEATGDQRFVGKQTVLGCGYNMGWEKFKASCLKYGRDLDDELCQTAVEIYREENPEIKSLWKTTNIAVVEAIRNPGEKITVRGKFTIGMASKLPFPALLIRLPSSHVLVYPYPELKNVWIFQKKKYASEMMANRAYQMVKKAGTLEEDDRVWKTTSISYIGNCPKSKKWGTRINTYGGSIVENVSQAIAGDFISHGMLKAEQEGYEVFLMVHDQALAHYHPERGNTVEGFKAALCTLPQWALDFPLAAECGLMPFYSKD